MTRKKSDDVQDEKTADVQGEEFQNAARERGEKFEADAAEGRNRAYEVADRTNGITPMPKSADGTPLTQFELESAQFFAKQNELEKQIDEIEVTDEMRAAHAGQIVNAVHASGAGGEQAFGSATVTNYSPGYVANPTPPTDYAHLKITSTDLTNNPNFVTAGLVVGDPFPPENLFEDARETDNLADLKDYMRRLRLPEFAITESLRTKYGAPGSAQENPNQAPSAT